MIAKTFALLTTAVVAALALELVFGVHLGIAHWVHRVLGPDEWEIVRPL